MGRHTDADGDGIADYAQLADPQSAAFRTAAEAELVTDDDIAAMLERGELADTTDEITLAPEDHEALRWDSGREDPKTVEQARAALAQRIDDPTAPDPPRHGGAYDEL